MDINIHNGRSKMPIVRKPPLEPDMRIDQSHEVYTHCFVCEACTSYFDLTYRAPALRDGTYSYCPTCNGITWSRPAHYHEIYGRKASSC